MDNENKPRKRPTKTYCIGNETIARLNKYADENGKRRSRVVENALVEFLEKVNY